MTIIEEMRSKELKIIEDISNSKYFSKYKDDVKKAYMDVVHKRWDKELHPDKDIKPTIILESMGTKNAIKNVLHDIKYDKRKYDMYKEGTDEYIDVLDMILDYLSCIPVMY